MPEKTTGQYQSRAARRQAMVKERRQSHMQRYKRNKREMMVIKVVSVALGLLILGAVGFAAVNWLRDRGVDQPPEGVAVYTYSGNHIEGDIDYSQQPGYGGEVPPAGGAHNSTPQQCDVYEQPIRAENAIHSLEHGAVWITYQPTLPADEIAQLRELAEGDSYMLMSPHEGLPTPIVLTAWNHQLQLQSFDEEQVKRFIRSYKNRRGVTPEFGAPCAGTTATAPTT